MALEANSPTTNVATQNFHMHTDTISKEQNKKFPKYYFSDVIPFEDFYSTSLGKVISEEGTLLHC